VIIISKYEGTIKILKENELRLLERFRESENIEIKKVIPKNKRIPCCVKVNTPKSLKEKLFSTSSSSLKNIIINNYNDSKTNNE
jgi:hypothetical protein